MAEVIGLSALERRFAAIKSPTIREGFMRNLGQRAVREQQLIARRNKKTGNLIASIHLGAVTQESVVTLASVRYAAFVEYGTKGGTIIRPRNARVLAWAPGPAGGKFRRLTGATRKGVSSKNLAFAMWVRRGATRPFPYMVPGAKAAVAQTHLTDEIVAAWNGAA